MSEKLIEDKYLFTFQDEKQLWIPREFIKKYHQLSFYDIIQHTEKYEDGSFFVDMPSFSMDKVIQFLMEENMDIDSLDLKESYDIYITLVEYSVTIDKEIQSDLLFHVKELFINYLIETNYDILGYHCNYIESRMPMDLFNIVKKDIYFYGLLTPQRKDELLYYSLLFKMMNITKKTELLLNPNSDEYIMEYNRLFNKYDYKIKNPKKNKYYTESEMNEYNKISSLDLNKLYYSQNMIESYNRKREKSELPKLYRYVVNEAIYTNNYSNVETNEEEDEYELDDEIRIEYDEKTNDKTFSIDTISSKLGISQLLCLPSYMYFYDEIDPKFFIKLLEEDVFDSITTLNIKLIKELTNRIDENLFNKIMTTHIFLNVTELIYDYDNATKNFKSLFPDYLMSMIDTIHINKIDSYEKEEIVLHDFICYLPHLKELLTKDLIIFDSLRIYSFCSANIKRLDSIDNYKHSINSLEIGFEDDEYNEDDVRNALEKFFKSNVLYHLNKLYVRFHENISIEYLTWISTLFNDNKFNTIHKLTIDLDSIIEDSSSEYLTAYENIVEKLIHKASIVTIKCCSMNFKNRLSLKGCFHNTTQLVLGIRDIPDDNFYKLYTTDNFPQLKTIRFYKEDNEKWWISFTTTLFNYINNSNFLSSSTFRLSDWEHSNGYIYDHNNSIFQCKYDTDSFLDTVLGTKDIYDEEQLSKLINFITVGKIPKLKELSFDIRCNISDEQITKYKEQLNNSLFIQKNHVSYQIETRY
ncbi:hypothetical protein WA158_006346 [Blastocystis sp. Blastoise]